MATVTQDDRAVDDRLQEQAKLLQARSGSGGRREQARFAQAMGR